MDRYTVISADCHAGADLLDRPDRLVIDLDPGPSVPWQREHICA